MSSILRGLTEGAYEDGVSDGKRGQANPRASSIYGPESNEYQRGYNAGIKLGDTEKQERVAQYQAGLAPYANLSVSELEQMQAEILQRIQERQAIYDKLRGSSLSFDAKKHLPPNHQELALQHKKDNDAFQAIHQVLSQKKREGLSEGEADYGPEYQEMVKRVGQRAKQGPMKTVWDEKTRRYKVVPVNPPKEQGVAEGLEDKVVFQGHTIGHIETDSDGDPVGIVYSNNPQSKRPFEIYGYEDVNHLKQEMISQWNKRVPKGVAEADLNRRGFLKGAGAAALGAIGGNAMAKGGGGGGHGIGGGHASASHGSSSHGSAGHGTAGGRASTAPHSSFRPGAPFVPHGTAGSPRGDGSVANDADKQEYIKFLSSYADAIRAGKMTPEMRKWLNSHPDVIADLKRGKYGLTMGQLNADLVDLEQRKNPHLMREEGVEEGKLGAAALAGAIALGGAMGYKHSTKDPNAEPTIKTKYQRNADVGAKLKKRITGDQKNEGVAEASPDATFNVLKGLKSYQVVIMNNYYRGKYSDYSGRYYYVLATSPEEAKQVVLDNADAILQDLLAMKAHNGRRILPRSSAVPITPDRIGKIEDGTVAGRMSTASYKKMYGPNGPMMVKLSNGAIEDVQGQEQNVSEETIHVGYRDSSGDWIKTTTHTNYADAKAAMERLVKRGKKGVQHRYDNKGNIDPGAMMTARPESGVAEDTVNESSTIDFIRGLISEFNTQMSGSPYYPMDYKNPGMRMWTRGDGSRYKDPGYIFIDRDLKPEDQPKWHKAKAVEKFWKFLESKGARKIGDVSGEFGSDPHSPAVVLNKQVFVFNGRSIAWGSTSRLKNSSVWRQKQQGVAEGLNEFAPDGFNGGDDDEGFSPEIAKMAQEDGFTKGVSLADGATLERAMTINHWHSQHGGMYKQYFAKGFKQGRMNKVKHDNRQYNLNLKLMKDGSIRHGEQGVAEGSTTTWEVCFDYGPHQSETVKVKAKSAQEAVDKVETAAEKKGRDIMVNWARPAEQGVGEGIMNKIANKVMGAAPEQPQYKVGQRVKYETSPHQPDWADGGSGVGVITAYKNGHYMINGNPVNHFEIKGVVEQDIEEEKQRLDPKCWKGYKKQGTKMKGDTRVNNCVPVKESAILKGLK